MPFKSKAQQAFLFAKHPEVAKKFAKETTKKMYAEMPKKKRDGFDKLVDKVKVKYGKGV